MIVFTSVCARVAKLKGIALVQHFTSVHRIEGASPSTDRQRRGRQERVLILACALALPAAWFLSHPLTHLKLLAYMPWPASWLAAHLGYVPIVSLLPQPPSPGFAVELAGTWALAQERYEVWFPLLGVALAMVVLHRAARDKGRYPAGRAGQDIPRYVLPLALVAAVALLGPAVTQPLRMKTVVGYANSTIALVPVLLGVLTVVAWRASTLVSPVCRVAERSVLSLALAYAVIWPALSVPHPLLPEDGSRPLAELHRAALILKRIVPAGEPPVFLVGLAAPLYLAGVPVDPRSAFDLDVLAPGGTPYAQAMIDRMGLIGPAQVDRALGERGTARTAVIVRSVLDHYRPTRRAVVEQIDRELEARYARWVMLETYRWSVMEVWRRR